MQELQQFIDKKLNNQAEFYLKAFSLSTEMVQKLFQNNVKFYEAALENSLGLVNLTSQKDVDVVEAVSHFLSETIKNTSKLQNETSEIITGTVDRIMEVEQEQHQVLDRSPINLFNFWSNLRHSPVNMFQLLTPMTSAASDGIFKNNA